MEGCHHSGRQTEIHKSHLPLKFGGKTWYPYTFKNLYFRLGYTEEAAAYIRRALIINPDYLAARENLENICSHLVERWHFRMLNDKKRNKGYKDAIRTAVSKGYDNVLDIGAGTGILRYLLGSTVTYFLLRAGMLPLAKDYIGFLFSICA